MISPTGIPTHTVGQAGQATGLSRKALRVYETKGLLPPAGRSQAGYRLYTDEDITTLRFIRQAKTLGLSLDEIADILEIRRGGTAPCLHVVALLQEGIRELDRTLTDLRQLRRTLTDTRATAHAHQVEDTDGVCRIIEHAPAAATRQEQA